MVSRAGLLEAYARSRLSREAFAAKHGLGLSTLYQWERQQRPAARAKPRNRIQVPSLLSRGPTAAPYRLHLAQGPILEVTGGFGPAELRLLTHLFQSL